MKTIYFVRHGESEGNARAVRYFQGEESKLTELGRRQARFIAERCARLEFDTLIASHAVRAQETAQYISELTGKTLETQQLFVERTAPRSLIGRFTDDPEALALRNKWFESFFDSKKRVEDGENFTDLKERALQALQFLAERNEERLLIVSHGFFLRMVIACITFGPSLTTNEFKKIVQTFRTSNTGLTKIEHEPASPGDPVLPIPEWTVRAWNDHAHLG